ncbi:rhodanese-like domain-containing protein [Aquirufa ecclesiirivi]
MTPSISIDQLIEKLQQQEAILLLDIRSKEEFEARHIPNAIHVPGEGIPQGLPLHANQALLVTICGKGGGRSEQAAQKLISLGFQATFLAGGTNEWFEKSHLA